MKEQVASLAVVALFAVACADPVSPGRSLQGHDALATVSGPTTTYPAGLSVAQVRVCKTIPGDAPAGVQFNFTATVTSIIPAGAPGAPIGFSIVGVPGQAACAVPFTSSKNGGQLDQVVIVEGAAPQGWTLSNIDVVQVKDGPNYVPPAGGYADSEDEATRTATVFVNDDMARLVTFTNTFTPEPPPGGNNGCTPGYWKQAHHFDSWPAGYTPGMSFNAALGLPGTNLFSDGFTLLDALGANGGGKNALARHAAAAILNAASGFYPLSVDQVKAAVLEAYNNASLIESKKNLLAGYNELGCTLN
jgi:hypothetical protein